MNNMEIDVEKKFNQWSHYTICKFNNYLKDAPFPLWEKYFIEGIKGLQTYDGTLCEGMMQAYASLYRRRNKIVLGLAFMILAPQIYTAIFGLRNVAI